MKQKDKFYDITNALREDANPQPTPVGELPEGFTKGDWEVSTTSLKSDCIIGKDKGIVCVIAMWRKEKAANAKLIAAAPAMLEALETVIEILPFVKPDRELSGGDHFTIVGKLSRIKDLAKAAIQSATK